MNDLEKLAMASMVSLGDTPDDIADTLRKNKIIGFVGEATSCPLAKFIRHNSIDGKDLSQYMVSILPTKLVIQPVHNDRRVGEVKLTPACSEFLDRFDGLGYTDLVQLIEIE